MQLEIYADRDIDIATDINSRQKDRIKSERKKEGRTERERNKYL